MAMILAQAALEFLFTLIDPMFWAMLAGSDRRDRRTRDRRIWEATELR